MSRPVIRALVFAVVLSAGVGLGESAVAKDCGDHVGGDGVAGRRVACACGDTVVTDTRLRAEDPVVRERCRLNGLRVRAGELASTITLDLAGLGIRGMMAGVGIDIVHGGDDGALVRGGDTDDRGQVTGFSIGLSMSRAGTLRRVENLKVVGCAREGLDINSRGTLVLGVETTHNGGHGIRVGGTGGRILDMVSTANAGHGLMLVADGVIVTGLFEGNTLGPFVVKGRRNDTSGVRSTTAAPVARGAE